MSTPTSDDAPSKEETISAIGNPLESVPLDRLRTRKSVKWRTYPTDVLPLWVAEMDVDLAEPIADVIVAAARAGDTGYSWGTGYAEALGRFSERRWHWPAFPVGRTALVPDVMMGVVEALKLVTGPGDPVVVNSPVYPPFFSFTEHSGRPVVDAPLTPEGRLDLAALDETFRTVRAEHAKAAYLLCNPHNPTGTVHTSDELTRVAALAEQYGVRVIVDEIHGPLVLSGTTYVPYLSVAGDSGAFTLSSASKGWNLAGLKAALLVAGAGAAEDLARLPEEVSHGPSHLGVLAHTAAFDQADAWLDALLDGLNRNRALLGQLLATHLPAVGWYPPQATFLAWLDCGATSLAEHRPEGSAAGRGNVTLKAGPAAVFLDQTRVALSAGAAFGYGYENHVRLNYATSSEILTEAIERMGSIGTA
jgi:cystathionine beta-lyase